MNIEGLRQLRRERDVLRSRLDVLLGADEGEFAELSDTDQELRLRAAAPIGHALATVEAAIDVEVDRLVERTLRPVERVYPQVVAMAAGRWVAGEAIPAKGGGFRNIASMMPVAVLRDHIAHMKELAAAEPDPLTRSEYEARLEVATDEELARQAGLPSPKPDPEKRAIAASPVQHRGEGLQLMTGGPQMTASAGTGYQIAGPGRFTEMRSFADQPGIGFARLAKLAAISRGSVFEARHWAASMYPDDKRIMAALQQNVGTAGGFLVPEEQAREMITLLRSRTIIRPNARTVPISGTMVLPVQTSGVAAAWLGEGVDDNAQDLTIGQRRLTARKLRALIAASNDLIRNSSPEADAFIRDELVAALASGEDQAFIRGDGVANSPKGLRFWALAANVNNGTGTSAAQIETDLVAMAGRLSTGMKGAMVAPRWLMTSRTKFKLYGLRDATNGELLFPEIRNSAPTLFGWPVSVTDLIPINLSPGTVTEIYLADMNAVLLGENLAISVAVSDTASYKDAGGALQSSFSRDETVLRAILSVDMVVARDEAVQVLTGSNVTY